MGNIADCKLQNANFKLPTEREENFDFQIFKFSNFQIEVVNFGL